jgi:hypothetical protein
MSGIEIMKVEIKKHGYDIKKTKWDGYIIVRTKWKKHRPPPYIDLVFNVDPEINLKKLAEENENVEYCGENGKDGRGSNFAVLKTPFGTMEIKRTMVMIPRFPMNREDEIINVKRYVQAMLRGEKKSFMSWVREDLKKFVKEEMEM